MAPLLCSRCNRRFSHCGRLSSFGKDRGTSIVLIFRPVEQVCSKKVEVGFPDDANSGTGVIQECRWRNEEIVEDGNEIGPGLLEMVTKRLLDQKRGDPMKATLMLGVRMFISEVG